MSKCIGCGVVLQTSNELELGFTKDINKELCERCFKIRNYNEYKMVVKENEDFIDILKSIDNTDDLVVLVVDLFNINKNLENINKYLNNNILLVLTKRDILPKSCYDKNIIEYFNNYNLNVIDTEIISSMKNYNFDSLYNKINKYKISNNVYVVGFTNAGKSTMINKILHNYSDNNISLTTSNLPSTTIDSIEVKVNDTLTLIDTPGLLDNEDIISYVDNNILKKIIPNKELKPITYQIKEPQTIIIENLVRIDLKQKNSITIYESNSLNVKRVSMDSHELLGLKKHELIVDDNSDIVVQGLCFIHVITHAQITLYTKNGVRVFVRKSLM